MYSDKISHALSFTAKTLALGPEQSAADLARPANLGILLARYDCDEMVVQAGILSQLLAQTTPRERAALEKRIATKFGAAILGVAFLVKAGIWPLSSVIDSANVCVW